MPHHTLEEIPLPLYDRLNRSLQYLKQKKDGDNLESIIRFITLFTIRE